MQLHQPGLLAVATPFLNWNLQPRLGGIETAEAMLQLRFVCLCPRQAFKSLVPALCHQMCPMDLGEKLWRSLPSCHCPAGQVLPPATLVLGVCTLIPAVSKHHQTASRSQALISLFLFLSTRHVPSDAITRSSLFSLCSS